MPKYGIIVPLTWLAFVYTSKRFDKYGHFKDFI